MPTTVSSVSTFAMEPLMKNSMEDWAWLIVKAYAIVPSRLLAPPKTTTRKVSTI